MHVFQLETLRQEMTSTGRAYHEFLRVPAMSMGLYRLKVGEVDGQRPHAEDEAYYVIRGRAGFRTDKGVTPVGPGSILFVEKHAEHRFVDIAEDLDVLVFFAPAEHSLENKVPS
jgi:quercetin dioxygenase-like cupin family protein